MIIPDDRNMCVSASIRLFLSYPVCSLDLETMCPGRKLDFVFSQRWQRDNKLIVFTACQRSCGKIMFSVVFIYLSVCTIQRPPTPGPAPVQEPPGTVSAHSSLCTGTPWLVATEAHTVGERTACILLECFLVTARKRSLGQGNVFTSVGRPGGLVRPPGCRPP